jgi:plasmid stability protein
MAQVLVRGIEPDVMENLKTLAKKRGRSLEAELRLILRDAATAERVSDPLAEARRIRAMFEGRTFSDSTELVREDRERHQTTPRESHRWPGNELPG